MVVPEAHKDPITGQEDLVVVLVVAITVAVVAVATPVAVVVRVMDTVAVAADPTIRVAIQSPA